MKYKFQLENKNIDVEITNSATFHSETHLKINKTDYNVCIHDSKDNEPTSFMVNNKLFQVELKKDSEGYPVGIFVDDEYYPASLLKIDSLFYYKDKPLVTAKSGSVKSFIPGNIKKIFFQVNNKVNEGDIVLIHEAMKMENEIKAPKTGVIKSMNVKEGDNILTNHMMFEIE
ncbi:MAG: hypothetical protein GY757_24775 [bacterium]|nr:hypothetical protein [bacterium]